MERNAQRRAPQAMLAVALLLTPLVSARPAVPTTSAEGPQLRPVATATLTQAQREARFAGRVLVLVNRRRAAHHLSRLRLNACVDGFADGWVQRLARRNVLVHSDLDRLMSRCVTWYAAENIAAVPASIGPRALVRLWMHSPGHRRNILSSRATASGVGVRWDADEQVWLAVQDFARRPRR